MGICQMPAVRRERHCSGRGSGERPSLERRPAKRHDRRCRVRDRPAPPPVGRNRALPARLRHRARGLARRSRLTRCRGTSRGGPARTGVGCSYANRLVGSEASALGGQPSPEVALKASRVNGPRACAWANSPKRCARIVSADDQHARLLRLAPRRAHDDIDHEASIPPNPRDEREFRECARLRWHVPCRGAGSPRCPRRACRSVQARQSRTVRPTVAGSRGE
jgi:hypothetical protein